MKKIILIGIILLLSVNIVFAQQYSSTFTINGQQDNFILLSPLDQFFMNLFSIGTSFTIVGDARQCGAGDGEPNMDNIQVHTIAGTSADSVKCSMAGCNNCLIDVWYSNENGDKLSIKKEYKDRFQITTQSEEWFTAQIYCCPHPECSDDSDCEDWYGTGSECIRHTEQDSRMQYALSSWKACSTVSSNYDCWFVNEANSCEKRTYSFTSGDCPYSYSGNILYDSLDECNNHKYICGNNVCESVKGETNGNCPNDCQTSGGGATSCTQVTTDDSGKSINNGGSCSEFPDGKYKCINSNLYVCRDFQSGLGKCWFSNSQNTGCAPCSAQTTKNLCELLVGCSWNIITNQCSGDFNTCQTGQKQCPDGTCQSTDCCNHGTDCGTGNGGTGSAKTITLTEYYSISDEDFIAYANGCGQDSDCTLKEGYNVKCELDSSLYTQMQKRIKKYYGDKCLSDTPSAVKIALGIGHWASLGGVPTAKQICDLSNQARGELSSWWSTIFKTKTGICVAKSTAWYGGIWEQALTIVGGLGLPAQYVVIATVFIIILILILALNLFKK
jgi:hypothetical protein